MSTYILLAMLFVVGWLLGRERARRKRLDSQLFMEIRRRIVANEEMIQLRGVITQTQDQAEQGFRRRDDLIACVTAERDKWQLEASKRASIVERQASDIVTLNVALRDAHRSNAVRRSNRT